MWAGPALARCALIEVPDRFEKSNFLKGGRGTKQKKGS